MARKTKADPIPDHLKFGYEHNLVAEQVRNEMLAAGRDPLDPRFHFDMVAERDRRFFVGRKTYAQVCQERNERIEAEARERLKTAPRAVSLTKAELDYLIEKLHGVNRPEGLDILEKVIAARKSYED